MMSTRKQAGSSATPALGLFRRHWARWSSSIAGRLVAVLLSAGILALGALGALTAWRFDVALHEQAAAVTQVSERQLANRLVAEAQLARARLEALGTQAALRLRELARRKDVVKAVESKNDVTIRELFDVVAQTSALDRLIGFDSEGRVIGSDARNTVLNVHNQLKDSDLQPEVKRVLTNDNSRSSPRGYVNLHDLHPLLVAALGLPEKLAIAHIAVDPVFDDFGDLIGAIAGIRVLGHSEATLENFTTLSNAGVLIMRGDDVVSAAGPKGVAFSRPENTKAELLQSDDRKHVARCVPYYSGVEVCAFTEATAAVASRDQMFRIGADQNRALMSWFLASAAITLTVLVTALLFMVRHTTRGLSNLAAAAKAVAGGNLDILIRPSGVGEINALSIAFSRMLANLRTNVGQIRELAYFDAVTQLANREKMRIDAPAAMSRARSGALFFLDLDGFKSINDTYGHRAGDVVLKEVANRLSAYFSDAEGPWRNKGVNVARIGGDEFAVLLPELDSAVNFSDSARGIIQILRQPFVVGGTHATLGASIGIALFPAHGGSYEELLVNADLAMYLAKQNGRNSFAFFTQDLADKAKERMILESDLKDAIQKEELAVHYQPKVSCNNGRICGVEALVRWNHPRLGYVSPETFLGIAEEIGVIGDIDRLVIERAISEIGSLLNAGADLGLAVNVTATEISDPGFAKDIVQSLRRHHFPPERFELEMSEAVAIRNPKAVTSGLSQLRQIGVRLAIDDFGAGYSNLATLARLPFDTLKIDRSLVQSDTHDEEKRSIVRIALALANELGLDSVAEGVESAEDFKLVADEGAIMAQGHFFSPAVPLDELAALIATQSLATKHEQPFPQGVVGNVVAVPRFGRPK